jgi:catechol 2,3-dioxygenase-like lactoylglutathione lyase family enzyme
VDARLKPRSSGFDAPESYDCCLLFLTRRKPLQEPGIARRELHMAIGIKSPGIHHLTLRSANLERSRRFYVETLGFPVALEGPNLFIFLAGSTAVAVRGPETATPQGDVFNPFRVGLDHVALACPDEAELERVAAALSQAGVENTGVKFDETLGKRYVAFKDPDRIAWEFYMA